MNCNLHHVGDVNRLDMAVYALAAVQDLCAAASINNGNLHEVDADRLAALLALIIREMKSAIERT